MMLKQIGLISPESTLTKYGRGIFETMIFQNGKLHLKKDHLDRISQSAKTLQIGVEFLKQLNMEIDSLEKELKEKSAVRITLWENGFFIEQRDIPYTSSEYQQGRTLCRYPFFRGQSINYIHKSVNYLENIDARADAVNRGFQDGLFLDHEENILEASMSNIFFIKDNSCIFPKHDNNYLLGIAQKNLKGILSEIGYTILEYNININKIGEFDYCFLTNSLMGAMPVKKIENIDLLISHAIMLDLNHRFWRLS